MRNYPLFKNKNKEITPINWQHTYVESLSMQYNSLVDYSNYFLADYRQGPELEKMMDGDNPITIKKIADPEDTETYNCYTIENLKYHQYRDTEEEAIYFLKKEDYSTTMEVYDPFSTVYRLIRSGRHIINNNQADPGNKDFKNWENIAIQPIGYTAFYIINFKDKKLNFTYTQNAELYYGTKLTLSILDFNTRFFCNDEFNETLSYHISNNKSSLVEIANYQSINDKPYIIDKQEFLWTDRVDNPVMGFVYKHDDMINNILGEELITDCRISYPIRIEKTSVVYYSIIQQGIAEGQTYWPDDCDVYLL